MVTLSARSLSKAFGPVQALADVSVEFVGGEIHAVLGENGAGKSTLMNVLAGFVRPDAGEVALDGRSLPLGDPLAVRARGLEMVHQHFMLVPEFTVAENLALSRLPSLRGKLDLDGTIRRSLEWARDLGWQVDPQARTGDLGVGAQQRVEILKALAADAPVLILDEPTASLSPEEVEDLFRVLRQLRDQGKAILLIAHKLAEIMAVADRATVLRRGRWVGSSRIPDTTARQLAEWMVGDLQDATPQATAALGQVALSAQQVSVLGSKGRPAVSGVSFSIREGEILGFGGVDGNGQVELAEALAGVRPLSSGTIECEGAVGYIPQDRQQDGLALSMSLEENYLVQSELPPHVLRGPFLNRSQLGIWASGLVDQYKIKIGKLSDAASSLSGGNQQKIVVSRTMSARPKVLVAVNPTRGLDFQATTFVHEAILSAARSGAAVALFTTDLDELRLLSSRAVFMDRGELAEDYASALTGGTE